ncbi:caspase-1-like [Microplitis mediator]|uniref:caspase-1-like n=1 Tax=Microplitis mediator TaxID=375433 RepID=UPI002554728E|nr:caspase-1-like [Microplitis mediator]
MSAFCVDNLSRAINNVLNDEDNPKNFKGIKINDLDDRGYKREIVTHYEMDKTKRNYAIIFNHENYDKNFLGPSSRRDGTDLDCRNLTDALEGLSFDVHVCQDFTHSAIVEKLNEVAEMDHTQHNCLLIVVMTHGDLGILDAYDTRYDADTIWCNFTPNRCPTLAGKPKLFFIQACQGKELDGGSPLVNRTGTDGSTFNYDSFHIGTDFLVAYATIAGFFAWRNDWGSWFIRIICDKLREHGTTDDILTILTYVIQHVAIKLQTYNPEKPKLDEKKQLPCIISKLTKLLKFYPKNESDQL